MELKRYLSVIWKWLWLIVLSTIVAGVASYYVTSQQPKTYQAVVTLLVGRSLEIANPNPADLGISTQLTQTYSQIARTGAVLEGTIAATGLNMSPETLASRLSTNTIPGTQLLQIRITDTDPQRAAVLANEVAHQLALQGPAAQQAQLEQQREFISQQVNDLSAKIREAQSRVVELQAQIDNSSSAREIATLEQQRDSLQTQIDTWRASYSQLVNLLTPRSSNYLTVLDAAKVPRTPVGPNLVLNVGLAALVGMMLATAAAFLLEYLDDTIKSNEDVERVLKLTTIGAIAPISGGPSKLIALHEPRALVSEAYRVLRTNIQFAGVDKPIKRVLVTSPGPMEGKSVTTANLAIVMAQAGLKTLLIDCDLRKPTQHKLFEVTNEFGLTNSLLTHGSPEPFMRPTRLENLKVMTTGPLPPNPAEILGSARMRELLKRLESEFDIVVVDSPPALPVADTAILTSEVDGVILVIQAGRTRVEPAARAKEVILKAGGRILGAVMNRVPTRGGSYYYYYRQYYSQESKATARPAEAGVRQNSLARWFGARR